MSSRHAVKTCRAIAALWVLALSGVLAASDATADSHDQCDAFKRYLMVWDWSPTVCIGFAKPGGPCIVPDNTENWIIHGLWPAAAAGEKRFETCGSEPKFSAEAIMDLVPDLKKVWPNPVFNESDTTPSGRYWAWRHEWQAHGTCAALCDPAVHDQSDFFELAMDLDKKYDVASVLTDANIAPNDTTTLATASVVDALHKAFGVSPIVECFTPDGSDTSYLYAIKLCFTPSHDLTDCQSAMNAKAGACPANVIYPTKPQQP